MTDSHTGVIVVSAHREDGLDCFYSEAKADSQSQPRRQELHEEPPRRHTMRVVRGRRQRRELWQRGPVEWSVGLSVFACGLFIGTMLARPATPSTTPVRGSAVGRLATVPSIPAATPPPAVRDERGTAGSEAAGGVDTGVGRDRAKVVDTQRPRAVVPALRGTLIVTSAPRGASVYVNNQLAGQTPLVMRGLSAGSRAVRLDLDGYARWSRGIQVVADQSTTISAQLARNQ